MSGLGFPPSHARDTSVDRSCSYDVSLSLGSIAYMVSKWSRIMAPSLIVDRLSGLTYPTADVDIPICLLDIFEALVILILQFVEGVPPKAH